MKPGWWGLGGGSEREVTVERGNKLDLVISWSVTDDFHGFSIKSECGKGTCN